MTDSSNKMWRIDSWHWAVRYNGREQSVAAWSRELGVDSRRLMKELRRRGVDDISMNPSRWVRVGLDEAYEGANTTRYEDDPICQVILNGHGPMHHGEIGVLLGMTAQRVQQVEAEALAKLSRTLRRRNLANGFREYLLSAMSRTTLDDRLLPFVLEEDGDRKPKGVNWSDVDWSLGRRRLAAMHGVSTRSVDAARKKHYQKPAPSRKTLARCRGAKRDTSRREERVYAAAE